MKFTEKCVLFTDKYVLVKMKNKKFTNGLNVHSKPESKRLGFVVETH